MLKYEVKEVSNQLFRNDATFVNEKLPLTKNKAIRAETVHTASVTFNGNKYNADETSITRMGYYVTKANFNMIKAIASGEDATAAFAANFTNVNVVWRDFNNSNRTITIADLAEIHKLAVDNLQSVWL